MPQFTLVIDRTSRPLPQPTEEQLKNVIFENNKTFTWWKDMVRGFPSGMILECQNQPRDLLVYGLTWKKISGRPTREHAATLKEKDLRKVENDPEYKHIWTPKA